MKRTAYSLAAAAVAAAGLVATSLCQPASGLSQEAVALGVDADPAGNTPTSLGAIETCISVSTGDTFEVDVFVTNVVDLLGWEAYFVYDPSIVEVVGQDVQMFQAANPGSRVFDTSEALPEQNGRYRVSAVDIAEPPAPDSGSGVLARLTLKALSAGVSSASLPLLDLTGDGKPDIGPTLTDLAGNAIGDMDGDGFFDGPISDASIAVGMPCGPPAPTPAPSPSPTPSQESMPAGGGAGFVYHGNRLAWAVACLGGGFVALLAGALVLSAIVRRQY